MLNLILRFFFLSSFGKNQISEKQVYVTPTYFLRHPVYYLLIPLLHRRCATRRTATRRGAKRSECRRRHRRRRRRLRLPTMYTLVSVGIKALHCHNRVQFYTTFERGDSLKKFVSNINRNRRAHLWTPFVAYMYLHIIFA